MFHNDVLSGRDKSRGELTGFITYLLNENDILIIGDNPASRAPEKFFMDYAGLLHQLEVWPEFVRKRVTL